MSVSNPNLCECGCGKPITSRKPKARFLSGHHSTIHGKSRGQDGKLTPTYSTWMSMRRRCHSPGTTGYERYGARGIVVCASWRNSFSSFLADMGERPPGTTLDRFPNQHGNYEPGNCRWATPKMQNLNSSGIRPVTAFGQTKALCEWSEISGVAAACIAQRLERGIPAEMAISKPSSRRSLTVSAFGATKTLKQWANETGVKYHTLFYRLAHGWSVERALSTRERHVRDQGR